MGYEYRTKWICPNEAGQIAAVFEKKAAEVYELAARLERIKSSLDTTWEGNSKTRFMATFENNPAQMRAFAEELISRAKQIRSISVSVTEKIWIPDPPAPEPAAPSGGGGGHSFESSASSGGSSTKSSSGTSGSSSNKSKSSSKKEEKQKKGLFGWW